MDLIGRKRDGGAFEVEGLIVCFVVGQGCGREILCCVRDKVVVPEAQELLVGRDDGSDDRVTSLGPEHSLLADWNRGGHVDKWLVVRGFFGFLASAVAMKTSVATGEWYFVEG